MTSTWDIFSGQYWLYHTLHVLNKKKMLMMALLKMYVLFSYQISYQCWINPFQECQQYSSVINDVNGWVGVRSCNCFLPVLLPKLTIIFSHLIIRIFFLNWGISVFTNLSHKWMSHIFIIYLTNDISMNDDDNLINTYCAPFLSPKNHENISPG